VKKILCLNGSTEGLPICHGVGVYLYPACRRGEVHGHGGALVSTVVKVVVHGQV
jgi:hypothetical protein